MITIELIKISKTTLEALAEKGVKTKDVRHIGMYNDYEEMKHNGEKSTYIIACLADKYSTSESNVKRILKRLRSQVKI